MHDPFDDDVLSEDREFFREDVPPSRDDFAIAARISADVVARPFETRRPLVIASCEAFVCEVLLMGRGVRLTAFAKATAVR